MKSTWTALLLAAGLLLAPAAHAGAKKTNKTKNDKKTLRVIQGIQSFYQKLKDLRTDFRQVFSAARFSRKQKERGRFFYRKPSMMRFQYTKPERKDFIYNGKTLWMYYPDDEEVKIRKGLQRSQLGIAFQFLWGSGNIDKSFVVKRLKTCRFKVKKRTFRFGHKGDICLQLMPRKAQDLFKRLYFSVLPRSFQIREVLYVDSAQNCNHFIFSNMKRNNKLPTSMFQFKVPKGVDVVQLR